MTLFKSTLAALAALAASTSLAFAQCEEVTFSDVGWTDITATTATTSRASRGERTRMPFWH